MGTLIHETMNALAPLADNALEETGRITQRAMEQLRLRELFILAQSADVRLKVDLSIRCAVTFHFLA